jgi:GT2 family glycosyltransferase
MSDVGREEGEGVDAALANWNGMQHIERCLGALFSQTLPPRQVVVVDNGSTDGSREWIRAHYPQVVLLENSYNKGFSAGYNRAIGACTAVYVLILNTDVFLEPGFIENALRGLAQSVDTGAVTGLIFQEGTREWINGGFFLRSQIRIAHSGNLCAEEEVFGCTGAVMLCRRKMLEAVRLNGEYFDETYFSYGEDIDLAWRAQLCGWKARFYPEARAFHVGSGSLDGQLRFVDKPPFFQRQALKNRYLTLVKNGSPGVLLRLLPVFLLTEPLVWLYLLVRRPVNFPYLLLALIDAVRLMPITLRKRRKIRRQTIVSSAYIRRFLRSF